jgi:hypothetical protein
LKVRQFLPLRRVLLIGAAPVIVVVVLLAVAQLVLPGIAAQRLRERLARWGSVERVEVNAFPAIELLWHHADRVVVQMRSYRPPPQALTQTLSQLSDVGSLDASAARLDTGLLTLRDATLTKRGARLSATGTISEADLRASFPALDTVEPVASSAGRLILQGTATLLGVTATVDVTIAAAHGALTAAPDVPFGGLATVTLFSDPSIAVGGVAASPAPGGFVLSAVGHMR